MNTPVWGGGCGKPIRRKGNVMGDAALDEGRRGRRGREPQALAGC